MTINETATSRRERELEALRAALRGLPFPARQDDVLAALVAGRAPSRLLWRAGCLSRERLYPLGGRAGCAELASRAQASRR